MKPILIAIFCFFSLQIIHAQDSDKTVTLTVSGTGNTLEEAKTNALRSAIEQAFGAYISSKTEILNDNLVKDEIVSVTNGNIQKFDIISQVEIPNNGYAMTLNATVSISKLTSFAQSKGVSVEIKGGLFAANIIQQELNEKAELKAVENILNTSNEILKKSFDYSIETKGNPKLNNGKYDIPLKISIKLNKNFYEFRKYFINSLSGLTMNESDIVNYLEINKPIGQLIIRKDTVVYQKDIKEIDIDNYNENTEKVYYIDYGHKDAVEVNSKKELKKIFKYGNIPDIIYKVEKNDLGYSKIYFRNNSSLELINEFLKKIKSIIFYFEINNNLINMSGNSFLSGLYKSQIASWSKIAIISLGSIEELIYNLNKNFFTSNLNENNISRIIKNENEYFPNLLSIFPLKMYDKNIILQFSSFKENDIISTVEFVDTKSLEEIKQLSEYKIKPKE
jgi:hypothetical protein